MIQDYDTDLELSIKNYQWIKTEALFTRDPFQTAPNGSVWKSDRIGVLFTRDPCGAGSERIQNVTGPANLQV